MPYLFKCDKLVRDNMTTLLQQRGITVFQRLLEEKEFLLRLKAKLVEEAREVGQSLSLSEMTEECADVLEVIYTLAEVYGIALQDIEQKRLEKKAFKGGFSRRLYHAAVAFDAESDQDLFHYFRSKPDHYPPLQDLKEIESL